MAQPTIDSIDEAQLTTEEKHALDILNNLSVEKLNNLKSLMNLSNPGVIGPTTLTEFVELCKDRNLDLSEPGVNQFKQQHQLDNTGTNEGKIGPTTAKVYFDELTAKRVFCPFAKKDTRDSNDAGDFTGGLPRGVLHTTEGPTFAGARQAFVNNNSWPHFTVTFEKDFFEAFQHLPIDVASRTLKHPSGTVETNRQSAIQIEIVGGAKNAPNFSQEYLKGIAKLMRWIEANAGVKRQTSVQFLAPPANDVRLSDKKWLNYEGWLGHQHVPHNDHSDPGKIDINTLLA
jgi:hypothetical protein